MAERIAYLEAVVGADITQFRKSMRDVRSETGILSDVMGGIAGGARAMTLAFTTPMVALGTYAVQAASTFDTSMRNINSIAQLPEDQLKALGTQVLEFGKHTRAGAEGAASALYEVYSAGIFGADAFNIMKIGSKTAEAGLADMTGTIKGLTAAGLTFGDTSEAAMLRYSNATTLAVQLGVGSMDVFNTGIQNVIGTGSLLGATFEDLSATIAFMSQRGISFASAGTYMNNALSKLIKPSEEMSKVFTELHVKSGKELISTFGGIEGALRAVYNKVGDSETEWAKLFPDVRGFKAVAPFIKAFKEDGNDAVNSFFGNFTTQMKNGNVTGAAWDQQMMSFSATLDHFKAALQGVAIVIGQAIIPVISPLIAGVTEVLNRVSDTNPVIIQMGVAFTAVVAAAFPIIWLLTSMVSPIGLIVGAVAALAVAFTTNFNGIQTKVKDVVTAVLGNLTPLKDALKDFYTTLFPAMPTVADITGGKKIAVNSDEIIEVEKPMSLWDLYEKNGYSKYFSWTEFMKKAKEGGWDGKGLNVGEKIILPDGQKMMNAKDGITGIATGVGNLSTKLQILADTDPPAAKLTFIENLMKATKEAWPKVHTALDTVFNNVVTWINDTGLPMLDGLGGKVLASITGWFAPTQRKGNSESYKTFRDMFGGGAAKGVQEGVGKLQDTFPQISAGLSAMVNAIGAWLTTEGIPTVSRSVGYFVGKIGATMGELMGKIVSYISGGGASKDGSKLADGIKDSVVDPAMIGFNDAMKDANVQGGINTMFSGIAGLLVAGAGVGVLGQLLMGKGFLSAIWSTLGTVMSGGVNIVSGIAGVGGQVVNKLLNTSAGAAVSNGVKNFGDTVMDTITTAISTAATTAKDALSAVATPILTAISSALETKALQSMMLWDTVMGGIGSGLKAASGKVTSLTGWVMEAVAPLLAPITGALAALFAAAPALPIILAGIAVVGILSLILPDNVKSKFADLFNAVFGDGSKTMKPELDKPVSATIDKIDTVVTQAALDGTYVSIYDQITGYLQMKRQQDTTTKTDNYVLAQIDKVVTQFKEGAIDQTALEDQVNMLISDSFKLIDTSGDKAQYEGSGITLPIDNILKPTLTDKATQVADGMLSPVWTAVAANIASQASTGNTDTGVLATSMTKPFIDEFTTHFGTTGDVTTKWQDFVTSFNTGIDGNITKINTLKMGVIGWAATAVVSNALAILSFSGYNKVRDILGGIKTDAEKLGATLNGLVSHSPYDIVVNMTTNGTTPTIPTGDTKTTPNGSNATGLGSVPYDNYTANLHEGEAVLDKHTAAVWRNLPQMMSNMKVNRQTHQPTQPTNVYVNGVIDFDSFVREAERRGYKLVKR